MSAKKGGGQTWSLDLILAAGIFILVLIAFYAIFSNDKGVSSRELEGSADEIMIKLDANSGNPQSAIVFDGKINEEKLVELSQEDYQELKRIMGVSKDFCIYIEDENGRIVPINGTFVGVGGDSITIDNTPCNSTIP